MNIETKNTGNKNNFGNITGPELAILEAIKSLGDDSNIDNLIQTTTLNAHRVYSILSSLEIEGYIKKLEDKYVIKK